MAADLLANVERTSADRPSPTREEPAPAGHWHGGAVAEVLRWKERALKAEAMVAELLRGR